MAARKVAFIGVPLDLGAGRRGVDMGPSALRGADLHSRVRELGYEVVDRGDIAVHIQETRDPGDPRLKYLNEIRTTCEMVRDEVQEVLGAGYLPVVLGGDHSIAMGTIAGAVCFFRKRDKKKVGLIWFDAHGDMNTPETSPSGNIHGMPLAAALGLGEASLTGLAGETPMVEGSRAAVVGLRDVDPAERGNIKETGIGAFTMRDIDERGMRAVMEEAIKRATSGTAGIHVSFDLDGVDPDFAPGVGTPSPGGLSYREAHLAMEMLADTGQVISAEFVEVNPILDHRNATAKLGVGLLASLLGKKIL
ncbi:MAG TPA: arginase [Vicinamibacteria bacterium]|nr:arginase [Vicinamibacteria bacterium]